LRGKRSKGPAKRPGFWGENDTTLNTGALVAFGLVQGFSGLSEGIEIEV
jgi:hypothetical protein